MQDSKWSFDMTVQDDDEDDVLRPKSAEELVDQFGIRTALLVLCIASFIAAMWAVNRPSFEKCSAVEDITERNACYDGLRKDLMKPPAKGAYTPPGTDQSQTSVMGQ
jgi:hypothetical protein